MILDNDVCLHGRMNITENSHDTRRVEGYCLTLARTIQAQVELLNLGVRVDVVPNPIIVWKFHRSSD